MNFQSLSFLAFLTATTAICLAVGRRAPWAGRLLLMVASLFFYVAGGGWQAFLVLAVGITVTA